MNDLVLSSDELAIGASAQAALIASVGAAPRPMPWARPAMTKPGPVASKPPAVPAANDAAGNPHAKVWFKYLKVIGPRRVHRLCAAGGNTSDDSSYDTVDESID